MKEKRFGKKHMVLGLMVLLLGAAVYLNYYVASNTPLTTDTQTSGDQTQTSRPLGESQFVSNTTSAPQEQDYFDSARQSREAARQEALDILEETLRDVKSDSNVQQDAVEAAAVVAQAVEQEDAIESLIKAKGFEDCVVYIQDENCHVTVQAAELDDTKMLQIVQIVTAQSDVKAEKISIVAVE